MMQDVIDECKKNDIILVLNLHHFDLPIELFQKYGGWEIYPKAIYDIAKNVQESTAGHGTMHTKTVMFHRSGFRNTETYSEKIWRVA